MFTARFNDYVDRATVPASTMLPPWGRATQPALNIAQPELQWRPVRNFWYGVALHSLPFMSIAYIKDCATRAAVAASPGLLVWARIAPLSFQIATGAAMVACTEWLVWGRATQLIFKAYSQAWGLCNPSYSSGLCRFAGVGPRYNCLPLRLRNPSYSGGLYRLAGLGSRYTACL